MKVTETLIPDLGRRVTKILYVRMYIIMCLILHIPLICNRYILDLGIPSAEIRQQLWKTLLPKNAPVETDIEFEILAQQWVHHTLMNRSPKLRMYICPCTVNMYLSTVYNSIIAITFPRLYPTYVNVITVCGHMTHALVINWTRLNYGNLKLFKFR